MSMNKTDFQRIVCLKKDLIELSQWIGSIEAINDELEYLKLLEPQLIKSNEIALTILGFRRKNTLTMGALCQYEQELKKELEYGKRDYDLERAREHEKRRDKFSQITREFIFLKKSIYSRLLSNNPL